jgi:hypothetical protein
MPILTCGRRLKLTTPSHVDLTAETQDIYSGLGWDSTTHRFNKTYMTVPSNRTLLRECEKLGFTHLYKLVKATDFDGIKNYYSVQGATVPKEWRKVNGQLQVVDV